MDCRWKCHTPAEHHRAQHVVRADLAQEHVAGDVEQDVGDVEDEDGDVVLVARHVQAGRQAQDLCVADVGAVDEGDEKEQEEDGQDVQIRLDDDPALELLGDGHAPPGAGRYRLIAHIDLLLHRLLQGSRIRLAEYGRHCALPACDRRCNGMLTGC